MEKATINCEYAKSAKTSIILNILFKEQGRVAAVRESKYRMVSLVMAALRQL